MNQFIELLNEKNENKNLDYKASFNWDTVSKDERISIIKDILAMSNTKDGGKIVIGVNDDDFSFTGVTDEEVKSFDVTKVNNLLQKYTDPKVSCSVYKENYDDKFFIIIDVPEFQEIPIICKKNCHSNKNTKKILLKNGSIYIRTDNATSELINSSEEMREFLHRAITKKEDDLLRNIESLIKNKPIDNSTEDIEKYNFEIQKARDCLKKKLPALSDYGNWEVTSFPVKYLKDRIMDQARIREILNESKVSLRGWDFPHLESNNNNGMMTNLTNGIQSCTRWYEYIEGFRLYKTGLFLWKGKFWGKIDIKSKETKEFDFINCIYKVTEFLLFIRRLYEKLNIVEEINIKISLFNCENRKLVSNNSSVGPLYEDYICRQKEPLVIERKVKFVKLKANYKNIAAEIIKEIFLTFNWNSVSKKVIEDWQKKLFEHRI